MRKTKRVMRTNRENAIDPKLITEHRLASIHPSMSEEDYTSLKLSIEQYGQKVPVILYKNKLIDGRNRLRSCIELGIKIMVCDLSSNATLKEVEDEIMTTEKRRHETKTQKAIQAFNFHVQKRVTQSIAAKHFGVSVGLVEYVSYIALKAKRLDILDKLLENKLISIEERRPTDSLSAIAKALKEEAEKEVLINNTEKIHWKADAYIKTEQGKDWYYNQIKFLKIKENDVGIKMLISELANLKFTK